MLRIHQMIPVLVDYDRNSGIRKKKNPPFFINLSSSGLVELSESTYKRPVVGRPKVSQGGIYILLPSPHTCTSMSLAHLA